MIVMITLLSDFWMGGDGQKKWTDLAAGPGPDSYSNMLIDDVKRRGCRNRGHRSLLDRDRSRRGGAGTSFQTGNIDRG